MLKLEGLTLSGFKSFVDRTDLVFPDGITCIVGPNGCGKSNILDSIAWVLGEQSPRALRGSKMEEVVFAGTRSRKPAGMAEVTLRFAPKAPPDGAIAEGDGAAEPESVAADVDARLREPLTITRRLYRNGDSEYLINDARARLKDIVQLIMGTGMGTRVYSIIEQGRVDQILNSKPTDRRVLIEEAAGITRYKAKRKAAKLKLDEAEQNLLRVTDIVGELEKQLRSLKRQVGTARRYKRLAGRRRIVLRALHAVKHRQLSDRLAALDAELAALRASAEESDGALSVLEGSTAAAREEVAAIESRRDAVSQQAHGMQLELEGARHAISGARQRLADLEERARHAEGAGRELDREVLDLGAARAECAERLRRLEADLGDSRGRLDACATGTKEVRERLGEAHRGIAETKEAIFEAMSESAGLRNRKQEVESAVARLEAQAARLAAVADEARAEVERLAADLAAGQSRLERALEREGHAREEAAAVAARLEQASRRAGELRVEADAARRELHEAEGQLAAVGETIRSRAAYGESVRRFLAEPPPGVLGAVADFVTVREGDELASEKALGRFLQAVVVDTRGHAEAIARELSEGQRSEIDFLFPDGAPAAADRPRPSDKRIVGPLAGSLSFDGSKAAWLARVVPQGWLVASAADCIALARKFPDEVFVSRDGVLLGPGGQGSAGRPLGEGDGILETRARHERLAATAGERRGRVESIASDLAACESERDRLQDERERAQAELGSAEKDVVAARHDVGGLRQSSEAAHARHASVGAEHEAANDELARTRERLEDLALKLAQCSTTRTDLERRLARTNELAARLEQEAEGADAELSRLREELAVKGERRDAARADLARIDGEIERLDARRRDAAAQIASVGAERAETEALLARSEQSVVEGSTRFEALRAELESADLRVREGRASLLEGAERLRDLRLEHDRRAKLASEMEVRRERIVTELEHGVADCRERLNLDPSELPVPEPPSDEDVAARAAAASAAGEGGAEASADEGGDEADEGFAAGGREVPVDDSLPWVDGVLDLAALERESEELRRKLDRIGPVNLVAIEEYDELAQRHGFLAKEQGDLVESIRSLRSTITEIDELSRERFTQAFETIRVSFDQAFQTLFRGGRAELRLQDEDDPLECGIEIIAQPPGKRLQNMMLLSGGEKALSAIALLFALFRYKPSPFCVLDEVDAPLDESNVLRFLDLVQEMAKETQFVIITHDRRSMERGNVLYGVTMQEPGCSKLVAVHFEGLERESAA